MIKYLIFLLAFSTNVFSQSGWKNLNSGITTNLFSVSVISQDIVLVCGSGGVILKSINSGVNWENKNSGTGFDLYNINFLNLTTGFVCGGVFNGNGLILKTTDAGENWQNVLQITNSNLYSVIMINELTGFSAGSSGNSGVCYKTTNGGNNWSLVCTINNNILTGISFLNSETGYASGKRILKTTNGGVNWSEQYNDTNYFFSNVFSENNFVYLCSYNGHIAKSIDYGLTWNIYSTGFEIPLRSLYFTNNQTGFVCGNDGYLFKTENAGLNWTRQLVHANQYLMGIDFVNSNVGFIAGFSGKILKTQNGGVNIQKINTQIPVSNILHQNFPNPFNPETNINFSINKTGKTTLNIYDINGKLIKQLYSGVLNSGNYSFQFKSENLSSGIYFYELSTPDDKQFKKMTLIK
ncbi:MAG TPA: hypothetical protein DEP28_02225 [Bacteroidetes bacterium]|nr:hypothetical protein [Bacteroidota bacterium]HCN36191.1 hypothetical protein [Bacteroidota bacterium]